MVSQDMQAEIRPYCLDILQSSREMGVVATGLCGLYEMD